MTDRRGDRGDLIPPPDIVYPYRGTDDDNEFRYSLRSLMNIPHGTVWIVGDCPTWVQGVKHLRSANRWSSRFRNALMHVKTACEQPDLADRFILMNDDFFILKPMQRIPVFHLGPTEQAHPLQVPTQRRRRANPWRRGIWETTRLLQSWGIPDPVSYELHIPMEIDRDIMCSTLNRALSESSSMDIQQRTLYGNVAGIGGDRLNTDVKVGGTGVRSLPPMFVSTSNRSFYRGHVGQQIRRLFPNRSPYES